jgi:hypothetical protein
MLLKTWLLAVMEVESFLKLKANFVAKKERPQEAPF